MFKGVGPTTIPGKVGTYGLVGVLAAGGIVRAGIHTVVDSVVSARVARLLDPVDAAKTARELLASSEANLSRKRLKDWIRQPQHHCVSCVLKSSSLSGVSCIESGMLDMARGAFLSFSAGDFELAIRFFRLMGTAAMDVDGVGWLRAMEVISYAGLGDYRTAARVCFGLAPTDTALERALVDATWNVEHSLRADHHVFECVRQAEPALQNDDAVNELRAALRAGIIMFRCDALFAYPEDAEWTRFFAKLLQRPTFYGGVDLPPPLLLVVRVYLRDNIEEVLQRCNRQVEKRISEEDVEEYAALRDHVQLLLNGCDSVPPFVPRSATRLRAVAAREHQFGEDKSTFWQPTYCRVCAGLFKMPRGRRCAHCSAAVHDDCLARASFSCHSLRKLSVAAHARLAPWLHSTRRALLLVWKRGPLCGAPRDVVRHIMSFL